MRVSVICKEFKPNEIFPQKTKLINKIRKFANLLKSSFEKDCIRYSLPPELAISSNYENFIGDTVDRGLHDEYFHVRCFVPTKKLISYNTQQILLSFEENISDLYNPFTIDIYVRRIKFMQVFVSNYYFRGAIPVGNVEFNMDYELNTLPRGKSKK